MSNALRFYVFLGPICVMHNAGRIKVNAWLSAKKFVVQKIEETEPGVFRVNVGRPKKRKPQAAVEIKRG